MAGPPPLYLLGDAAWRWGRVLRRRCGAQGGQGAGDAGGGRAAPSPSIPHAMAALSGVGAGDPVPAARGCTGGLGGGGTGVVGCTGAGAE